jgi:hypothetical protein
MKGLIFRTLDFKFFWIFSDILENNLISFSTHFSQNYRLFIRYSGNFLNTSKFIPANFIRKSYSD